MSYLYQTPPPVTHGLIHANNSLFSLSAVELERMQNGKQYLLNWKTLGLRHLAQMCRGQSVAMSRAFWSPRCAQRAEEADKDTCTHRKHIYISAFSRRCIQGINSFQYVCIKCVCFIQDFQLTFLGLHNRLLHQFILL